MDQSLLGIVSQTKARVVWRGISLSRTHRNPVIDNCCIFRPREDRGDLRSKIFEQPERYQSNPGIISRGRQLAPSASQTTTLSVLRL